MKNLFGKESKIIFVVGAVVGVAAVKFLKSKSAHNLAVKGLAKGIVMKDNILEEVNSIKEEAEDICEEAKVLAKKEVDEVCDCECEC